MLRAENKTGQDLCCANSIPKEHNSRSRQGWDIKPHTDKHPLPCSQGLRTAFPALPGHSWAKPFSQRAFMGLCQEISIITVTRKRWMKSTARVSRRIPFQYFISLFPGFHSIASPARCACLQRHKEADGKLSTCLTPGNQGFILHLPLSLPSSTKHRPGLQPGSHTG